MADRTQARNRARVLARFGMASSRKGDRMKRSLQGKRDREKEKGTRKKVKRSLSDL
jgi:hypothetical protein